MGAAQDPVSNCGGPDLQRGEKVLEFFSQSTNLL
jgi:hypothetical protein